MGVAEPPAHVGGSAAVERDGALARTEGARGRSGAVAAATGISGTGEGPVEKVPLPHSPAFASVQNRKISIAYVSIERFLFCTEANAGECQCPVIQSIIPTAVARQRSSDWSKFDQSSTLSTKLCTSGNLTPRLLHIRQNLDH